MRDAQLGPAQSIVCSRREYMYLEDSKYPYSIDSFPVLRSNDHHGVHLGSDQKIY
jgi:hypothetical protein